MKKYTVKPGQKVTIEINRKSKVTSSRLQAPGKGLITTRKDSDYQARRLQPGGITFYDLGLTKLGDAYIDIDSQLIKAWTNTGGSGIPFPLPLDDSDYAIRDALVLANLNTAAQIKPEYTEVIEGVVSFDDEDVLLIDSSSVWTSKGLKVTSEQLAADNISIGFGSSGNYFDSIKLKGSGENKITAINDYDADAVEFQLKAKDKIYMVPVYCRSQLEETFSSHMGFFNFVQQLNYFWMFFPRVPLLNGVNPIDIDGKDLPNARVMRSTQTTFGGVFTNTELGPEVFESSSTNSLVHALPMDATPEGFLIAVIKQGADTFYVWKN